MAIWPGGSSDHDDRALPHGDSDEDGGYCFVHEQHLLPEGVCGECAIAEQEVRDGGNAEVG